MIAIKDMTMRDYFAAMAMQGLLSLQEVRDLYVDENGDEISNEPMTGGTWMPHTEFFGSDCYVIADEMIKARDKAST